MRALARPAAVVASAILYAAAFPPWNFHALAWGALVPFLLSVRGVSPRRGAALGLLWGVAMIWAVGHWLPPALAHYYQQPLWFGLVFSAGASVVFIGIYHAAFAASLCWLARRVGAPVSPIVVAALWVAWEFAKARMFTGDPWLLLGYALAAETVMIQVADVGSVYALSFVVMLANATLAEFIAGRSRRRWRGALLPLALLLGIYGYGRVRLAEPLPAEPRVPVVVVQGNNDMGAEWRDEIYGAGLETYLRLSYEAAPKDVRSLIVWPESSVTFFVADEPLYRRQIGRMLEAANATLVLGGPDRREDASGVRYHNSAFYLDATGEVRDRYDKGHLMPFAEYFPLRTVELLRRRFERVRYFTPGQQDHVLRTEVGAVATVICFEGMFPEIVRAQMRRGAELLLNLSNDAWLGSGAGPEQHLWMAPLRAVESRTWVVRATTTGISAVIDPYGRIVARAESDTATALRAAVVPMRVATPYESIGDAFAWACVALAMAQLARPSRRPRRE